MRVDEGNTVATSNWYWLDGEKYGRIVLHIQTFDPAGWPQRERCYTTHLETKEGDAHAFFFGHYLMTLKEGLEDFTARIWQEFRASIAGERVDKPRFELKNEAEIRAEIAELQKRQDELPPLDCGRAIYGTRIATLAWVLGDTTEKPSG